MSRFPLLLSVPSGISRPAIIATLRLDARRGRLRLPDSPVPRFSPIPAFVSRAKA
ncbi:MAG TPA: hypothetical protein VN203_04545 [Candidatus Acidoferrum sp.]|nr:hypothetical protein [Candidatus Acidoferrum sp.]